MEVRDKLNTKEGYQEIIDMDIKFIRDGKDKIRMLNEDELTGIQRFPKPNIDVIKSSKDTILTYHYELLTAKYSLGLPINEIREEYIATVKAMSESWKQSNGYVQMVFMLSIGIMLDIHSEEFENLISMVEKDNPKDFLIDFLIRSRKNSWDQHTGFKFSKPFQSTAEIVEIAQTDKGKAVDKLQKYIQKEWYKSIETKTHESKFNIHSGYRCFESGALVKILGLDDSNLKDQPYYPFDLVHNV